MEFRAYTLRPGTRDEYHRLLQKRRCRCSTITGMTEVAIEMDEGTLDGLRTAGGVRRA